MYEEQQFLDKVHGGWYGKCLGGAAGAPVEGVKKLIKVNDFTEIFNPDLPNDDLDIQLLWLDVLEQKGYNITSCDLADAWIEKCWYPFSEYGYFMKNYMRGVKPPYSGILNNRFFKEGMGCAIRSEIWGMVCAGRPELAVLYAYMDGCLDHADNAVYAEQFLAAVESLAFEETDIEILIQKGLQYIPSDCKLAKCIQRIVSLQTLSWREVRNIVLREYGHPDFTNIVQNMGFIVIALLYGRGDMRDTINIALQCGYDTDCTCASAASIVGIIKGFQGLGELTTLINDYFVCGIDVKRPSDSIFQLAQDTVALAMKLPEKLALNVVYPTQEGWKEVYSTLQPTKWKIYGPYFRQLEQPIDTRYPSPHEPGCTLPDIVCMVNNEVSLSENYPKKECISILDAYEDLIEVDTVIAMEGQYACYAETTIISPENKQVWAIVGNNDGFRLEVNGETVLEKDEIRLWTPYNNFCLISLREGENRISIKLLRRTEKLRFGIGFRIYNGNHWHRSKWCTDLESK